MPRAQEVLPAPAHDVSREEFRVWVDVPQEPRRLRPALRVLGAKDADAGAEQNSRVEQNGVDTVEPSQRPRIQERDVVSGEPPHGGGSERVASEPRGPWDRGQHG